ncbi:MAG: tetratricopeptide repeat protein, partial [Bradymonadaceae bacterium]
DRALKSISKVIDKARDNPEYIFIRGLIRFDRGNYDTARRDFNKAYEIDPLYHKAYFYVGRTSFAQGDHKTALKIFRQVLDDKPKKGEYRFWMGRAFEELGRLEDALREYRKVTKHNPEYGQKNPKLFIRRGHLLVRLNLPDRGRQEIKKALEVDPNLDEARLAMAEADFSSKDYQSAIENFRKVLDDAPKNPEAQYKLGMALVYEDRKREGAEHLQNAIRYGYDDPEVYRTLGYLYKELGRSGQAIESFKSYLRETADSDIDQATQREILNQIKELGG